MLGDWVSRIQPFTINIILRSLSDDDVYVVRTYMLAIILYIVRLNGLFDCNFIKIHGIKIL